MDDDQSGWGWKWIVGPICWLLMKLRIVRVADDG